MSALFLQWLSDTSVRYPYNVMIGIIAVAQFMFGATMVIRDIRKGGPTWPLHWNMLVGIWILALAAFFSAAFCRLWFQADLIYLLRTLQMATIMTVWVAWRWARADVDGNAR